MTNDLFEHAAADSLRMQSPLAQRVAPHTLDDIVGQDHILGPDKILRRAIEADRITSIIFYGPPGCGKSALARVIAMRTKAAFEHLNAVTSNVKELRSIIGAAKQRWIDGGRRTIVFVDEIHRFNKLQQDALLPDVENGTIILIGATTENPYFSIVAPLLSRSRLFELKSLDDDDIIELMKRALVHPERGLSGIEVKVDKDALQHIAVYSEGDTRRALNALDVALLTTTPKNNVIHIDIETARDSIQKKLMKYDKGGDAHYDAASAFIKSMRGSDPDSAVYWMARMLEAGEEPRFVARRICIAASEDVGNADPMAIVVATSAWQSCELIGMPEAQIILAQAATYVACAPKSNASYKAIHDAMDDVRTKHTVEIPKHLQDGGPKGDKLGKGIGYKYAHDFPEGYVEQDYGVPHGTYYKPVNRGKESEFKDRFRAGLQIGRHRLGQRRHHPEAVFPEAPGQAVLDHREAQQTRLEAVDASVNCIALGGRSRVRTVTRQQDRRDHRFLRVTEAPPSGEPSPERCAPQQPQHAFHHPELASGIGVPERFTSARRSDRSRSTAQWQ